ncbi:MAG: prohibitin family protein [Deltaproteobacteria bacterium]|nr:prohibitin family protein [Deltaproteobacteria bacterium]MBW2209569.1 prohibitin family protein [Deltaproteobacteria bacterium]MBW2380537.1 prohibitin family protein [Deltaproteobacteria bacterium]MBW2626142.1 prohibitin family protein [Deltaproteobacteria bacterium]MBW2684836.1 prohibitin family protein [Deltaproteobacteria bacterium]
MKFKQNVLRIVSAGLLIIGATGCTQVNAGNLGVVTKWGEIQDVALQEGIHFRTPVKTQIINISTRVHKMEASATASSKDLQVVSTRIALNYRVDAAQIVEVFRNVGTRLVVENTIIDPALQESLKQATAQYTAEELITRRQQVKETLTDSIRATLAKSNLLVTELSITDFQFDAQYQQAVESKQVAEQRALTARNDLARIKVEAEQAEAKALGVAKAMLARAEAEAKAQELLRKTISAEIVYLRAVEKWDGKQPTIVGEGGAILDLGAIKKAAGR